MPIHKLTFKVPITEEIRQRFMRFVEIQNNGCWLWKGYISKHYGNFTIKGVTIRLPRAAWLVLRGEIPIGLEPDHLCRYKPCANPDHMELVTHHVNVLRGDAGKHLSDRTHCPMGHPYSGDNLHVKPSGARRCKQCSRMQSEKKRRDAGVFPRKTHCPRGHEFSPDNTRMVQNKERIQRLCRTCSKESMKRFRGKKSAAKKLSSQGNIITENLNNGRSGCV